MSSDPAKPGDPGGDAEGAKTRFVPRTDVVDRSAPGPAEPPAVAASDAPANPPAAAPAAGAPAGGTIIGRTRLMGDHGQQTVQGQGQGSGVQAASPTMRMGQAKTEYVRGENIESEPVAGWVVVVKGPGRGGFRPVFVGMNSVGRDASQRVSLSFGDDSISREEHAFITYDDETRTFYLQHGGKSNLVRLGGAPVLQPTVLKPNDLFRIGNTTFRFVACCGPDFNWSDEVADA